MPQQILILLLLHAVLMLGCLMIKRRMLAVLAMVMLNIAIIGLMFLVAARSVQPVS
jgi:hypothetical protein